MSVSLMKVEAELRHLNDELRQQSEVTFCVDTSVYKSCLIREIGALFSKSLKRQPSASDIGQAIVKVMRGESKNKFKFNKAKTFCGNRLTDLRCEERRRLFGIKPCANFPTMSTSEFAERFMLTIKAPDDCRMIYIKNLALLRKFSREVIAAPNSTFKLFREWLDTNYSGCPIQEQWEAIMLEDKEYYQFSSSTPTTGNEFCLPVDDDDYSNDNGQVERSH